MAHPPLRRNVWLVVMAILLTLSCALPAQVAHTPPATTALAATPTLPPAPTHTPPPRATALPRPTQVHPTPGHDPIQVDYAYVSNLITVLYPLYGSRLDDFVVVTLTNTRASPAQVIVTSEIAGYTNQAIDTVTLAPGETTEVRQNPRLIPAVIDQLDVQKPAEFHLHVAELADGVEKTVMDQTGDTLVYARRDFPWSIPGFTDAEVFELLAAMVTPNDAAVEGLIRNAANYTSSGSMWNGYGDHVGDDNGGVWERLQAIWQAEAQDYNLTYISTRISFAPGSVQRIRLPAETLAQHSGNCIETALLFASAAEALGLETAIIGIPGHAFTAVRMDEQNADYYFIETTLIGQASFKQAVDLGAQEFQDAQPHLDAQEEAYGWVTIQTARADGILPLPWP